MRKTFTLTSVLVLMIPFVCFSSQVQSQSDLPATDAAQEIWSRVEIRLPHVQTDDLSNFILQEVQEHCGQEYECLFNTYRSILENLEYRNKFLVAIPVSEEMVKLARAKKDADAEAYALKALIELYNFIEDIQMNIILRQELLELYERSGNQAEVIRTKVHILESRAWQLNETDQILPEVEGLLKKAIDLNLTETANFLRTRLKYLYEEFGYLDKLTEIIVELEQIPVSDPIKADESRYALHAASGRADLLRMEKKYDQAAALYQKALGIARMRHRAHFDTWLEVYVLLRLGKLEAERGDNASSLNYLDTAFTISNQFNMHGHTVNILEQKSKIAEKELRFEDALQLMRDMYATQAKMDSVSSDFDVKKYYLQRTTEQLTAEKERQTLAIQLKNSQLRNSFVIALMFSLLAVGLFIGFYQQNRGKKRLAVQNQLIHQQAEQLKSLDAAKSRFFANVSHELRTPLTLMLGPVNTLLKGKQLTEQQSQLLQMTKRNGQQLHQLINDILDLRKLELNKMEVHFQATNLNSYFRQHLALFESLAESKQIDYSYQVSIPKNQFAAIDQGKCRQILSNLLSNAFKFTFENGQIRVEAVLENKYLKLRVSDTGRGIHPDDLPYLFDRYFQTSRPDKIAEGGTGIGLALCKEYVELFGGQIEVDSALGQGSVFTLGFPVALVDPEKTGWKDKRQRNDDGPQITSGNLAPPSNSSGINHPTSLPAEAFVKEGNTQSRPTILVVEDNPDLRDYIRLILREKYEVVTAENGRQALELLQQQPSTQNHLILSDLMMPVMDGFQLLEKLKSNNATAHIPVVMLTARAELDNKLKALRIGVDDYLIKPFNETELLLRIENLLKNLSIRQKELSLETPAGKEEPMLSQADRQWLESFEKYVKQNLSNSLLSVPYLGNQFSMSESTLLRHLKRLTGLTPNQYLQEVRLNEARRLLENQVYNSVSKIAEEVGYGDTRSFSRRFKKRFGKLPSEV